MAASKNIKTNDVIIGKLSHGCDLLEELNSLCAEKNIRLGKVEAIGAVQKACVGYFNQETREYQFLGFDKPHEILNLTGNISIKDEKPFVHAHITLSDEKGNVFGGHLAPGTVTFACEYIIQVYSGTDLKRELDTETSLPLWKM